MKAARRYSFIGAALAAGAPLGLLFLRCSRSYKRTEDGWVGSELRSDALTYSYVYGATTVVFSLFGFALGRNHDRLVAKERLIKQQREAFAAVVAHDLRGPIQALRMQSELLLERVAGGRAPVSTVEIERVRRVAANLARMVDDLLDAGRIEARRVTLDCRPTEIDRAALDLVERMRAMLEPHPLSIDVLAATPVVPLDRRRFDQVLTNLLENAAKYSEDAQPIRVVVQPAQGGVEVSVEDFGVGIAADELPRLFERFYQANRARAKKSGLGLGLHICKGLMDAHHGRIWVDSALGKGSVFHLWFPSFQ